MSDSRHLTEQILISDLARVSSGLGLPLREILRHDDGSNFGRWILLYWSEQSSGPHWIDFEIIEGVGCLVEKDERSIHLGSAGSGPVLFYASEERVLLGQPGLDTTTTDLDRAVWSVRGFVKRDGCTQVYFPASPLHYDCQAELRGMLDAVCRAQDRCYQIYAQG